jgi:methylmalonyl-CoA mutase cobalamin-binding domain/chain
MDSHLVPAMTEVGRLFEENEYFVPELLISARAMQEVMKILNPLLKTSGVQKVGRVVIGTVKGDFHDIGKNLVASMLEGGGFDVVDLGVDVSAEKFADAAREQNGSIVAMSALLTTTMTQMKSVIEKLESDGLRSQCKVIIGGAPVTADFAKTIGADGYSDNANAAVALAKTLV